MTVAIDLKNIRKHYKLYPNHMAMALDWAGYYRARFWAKAPDFPVKRALDDVTLQIGKGDRVGIIGRNGAGKTTLLKIAAGMARPTSGRVRVGGRVQVLMRLGAAFHPDFSGAENIRHSLLYSGVSGRDLQYAYDKVVDFVELGDFIDQPMRTYSLGMSTRLQFAVATAITPDILIIDEVLGAGDAYFAAKSADRMRALTRSGCTLLLVSHARAQITEFCTSAIWMDQGRVRAQGDVETVTRDYDRAIAEAVNQSEHVTEIRSGILGHPQTLKHPDYLRNVREVIESAFGPLIWSAADRFGALLEGKAAPGHGWDIRNVRMLSNDALANHVSTGERFRVGLDIVAPSAVQSEQPVKCHLLFFADGGHLIGNCSTVLPRGSHGPITIDADLTPIPLGYRDYMVATVLEQGGQALYAMAGFFLKLVETNEGDPPYIHYPATWFYGADPTAHKGRVNGTI